jgi:hypothetical protein
VAVPVGEEGGDVTPESGLARKLVRRRDRRVRMLKRPSTWLSQLALVGVK